MKFIRCRASFISKVYFFCGILCCPLIGIGAIYCFLCAVTKLVASFNNGFIAGICFYVFSAVAAIVIACFGLTMSICVPTFEMRKIAFSRNGIVISEHGRQYKWSEVKEIGIIAFASSSGRQIYSTEVCIAFRQLTGKDLRYLCRSYAYGVYNQKHFLILDYSEALLQEIQDLSGLPIIDHRPEQLK